MSIFVINDDHWVLFKDFFSPWTHTIFLQHLHYFPLPLTKVNILLFEKSPDASSFFFVAKKDGGLRPCIDYRTLNNISVKFHNPLPLVPAALEYLRGATIFNKLDLRSMCNLIWIRERDEWKTAFVTLPATMNIWLCRMTWSTVFQDFMHEVLREYLHCFILVYIDDILIYSRAWPNIATTLQRSSNDDSINSSSRQKNVRSTNPQFSFSDIILTVVASGWTRVRWKPSEPGKFHLPSRNSKDSWDSAISTADSSRTTVPSPVLLPTYSATNPSLCPGPQKPTMTLKV